MENSSRDGNTQPPYLPAEKSLQVKKQQLDPDMKQQTGSKVGKEYIKAVYCHIAYLINFYAEYIMWNENNCTEVWTFLEALPSLGLEWKLTFSSPIATAELSKFASMLSAALKQYHLAGFQITQLEFSGRDL